jgi:hypothetical protein
MSEEKKTGRWAKSLDRAGLLDPIADGWELSEAGSGDDVAIVVDKRATEPPPDAPPSPRCQETDIPQPFPSEMPLSSRSTDSPAAVAPSMDELRQQMNQRFEVADYSGALEAAERLLDLDEAAADASICRQKCQATLLQMYESRIGSFQRIPSRIISEEDIIWRTLDTTSAFLASNVDGVLSFEDLIDISTVSRFDTCRILSQLLQEGIIK